MVVSRSKCTFVGISSSLPCNIEVVLTFGDPKVLFCVFAGDCELLLLLGSCNGMGTNNPQNTRINKLVRMNNKSKRNNHIMHVLPYDIEDALCELLFVPQPPPSLPQFPFPKLKLLLFHNNQNYQFY